MPAGTLKTLSTRSAYLLLTLCAGALTASAQGWSMRKNGTGFSVEYIDLLRQTSDKADITAFSSSARLFTGFSVGTDSVTLTLSRRHTYAELQNKTADLRTVLDSKSDQISAGYSFRCFVIPIEAGLLVSSGTEGVHLSPRLSLSFTPPDSVFRLHATGTTGVWNTYDQVALKDYALAVEEGISGWELSVGASVRPVHDLDVGGEVSRSDYRSKGRPEGRGLSLDVTALAFGLTLRYAPGKVRYDLRMDYADGNAATELLDGGTRFSRLVGKLSARSASLGMESAAWGLHLRGYAGVDQWRGSSVGHAESWPFTALAATVFQGRINARGTGLVTLWQCGIHGARDVSVARLSGMLSYGYALADVQLESWEPEFLVFGLKNYQRHAVGFRSAHFVHVGVTCDFSLIGLRWTAAIGQYVPLTVAYRTAGDMPSGAPPPLEASRIRTDGGRSYMVTVRL